MHARKAISLVMLLAAVLVADARASDFAVLPAGAAPPNGPPVVINAVPHAVPLNVVPPPVVNAPAPPLHAAPPVEPYAADGGGSTGHFYAQLHYLYAWLQTGNVPPLATTSVGLPRGQAGVEGIPGNAAVFGGPIADDGHSGGLFRIGYVLDSKCRQGFEFGLIFLGREGDSVVASSDGSQGVLARLFFNTQTGAGDAELVAFPGLLAGSIRVRTTSDLVGTEVNYRAALSSLSCGGCGCGEGGCSGRLLDFLLGVRTMRYRDKVTVDTLRSNLDAGNPVSNRPVVQDSFYSKTLFVGLQIGLEGRVERNDFFLEGRATAAALGQASGRVDVNGFSDVVTDGVVQRQRVGLLAGRTNIGFYGDDDTGFLSELTLRAGYRLGSHLSISVGYTALYLSSVMRSGSVIDTVVNTTQIPPATLTGPSRPLVILQNEDVWAHALSLGVEWKY